MLPFRRRGDRLPYASHFGIFSLSLLQISNTLTLLNMGFTVFENFNQIRSTTTQMAEQAPNGRPNNFVPQYIPRDQVPPNAPYAEWHDLMTVPIPGAVAGYLHHTLHIHVPEDQSNQAAQDARISSQDAQDDETIGTQPQDKAD